MPQLKDGIDFVTGNVLSFQQMNRMKNNWYSGATAPANPVNGMVWVKNDGIVYVYFGAAWVNLLSVLKLTGASYENVQDFINTTMSSGRISGGTISDDGDGTITVAAGTGFIKSSDISSIEETYFFNWAQDTTVGLTNNAVNYIYIEYNAGTPRIQATITRANIRLTDMFTLGRVYKENGTLHIVNTGVNLANHRRLDHERLVACRWIERSSGGVVSEPAALKLKTTNGVFYIGADEITTTGKDTSVADTFTGWYRDGGGGWTKELVQTDVNIEKYDDGDGVLGDIPVGRFSARYVYIDFDGHIHVQYGQQGDKLGVVQAEVVPAPPDFLNSFAILAARVIVKDGDSPLVEIAGAYIDMFAYQGITEHEDLGGVTSDQHHAQIHAPSHIAGAGDPLAWAGTKTTGAWAKSIGSGGDYPDWATMIAAMPDLIAHAVTITIKAGTTLTETCDIYNKHGVTTAGVITVEAEKYYPPSTTVPTADSATATTLRDAELAAAAYGNDYFNGCWIRIVDGTGTDNGFVAITDYIDATGDVVVANWPGTQPDNTSRYIIVGALIDSAATRGRGLQMKYNTAEIRFNGIGFTDATVFNIESRYNNFVYFVSCGVDKSDLSGILTVGDHEIRFDYCGIVGNNTSNNAAYAGITGLATGRVFIEECGISDNSQRGIYLRYGSFGYINDNFGDANGVWGLLCESAAKARFDGTECSGSSGNHRFADGDFNAINLEGGQIAFPAAQVASADPNTLDDYEEGAWTPDLQFGGAKVGITYVVQEGLYTKIGRKVTVVAYINLTSKGTSVGNARIMELPFVITNIAGSAPSFDFAAITFADMFIGVVVINTSEFALREVTNAGAAGNITDADFANNSVLRFTLTYFTD